MSDAWHPFAAHTYSGDVSLMKPRGRRALDRILDASYISDLDQVSMDELRNRREEAEHEESWLSYTRRMLHGRIDILQNRDTITADGALDIDALVQSLAAQVGGSGPTHTLGPEVVESPGEGRRAVERLIARSGLDDPTDDDLAAQRLSQLRQMEAEVSEARAGVHEVQEAITAEIARRYRDGEVDLDTVLESGS